MPRSAYGLEERFWAKVDFGEETDCWTWTACKTWSGYGCFAAGGRSKQAHRTAYELTYGPIPDGLQIDHLCRNRACVNPTHLEPVTARVNILRGESESAKHALQTECKWGHPFDLLNTFIRPNGRRECRACNARRQRDRYVPRKPAGQCVWCGADFRRSRSDRRFCSNRCSRLFRAQQVRRTA